jgi:beta-lactamase regulating signal transducer with metallopeptidase domain
MIIALAWLWQGLVLAGLACLLVRALPHVNAATRHAIWWAALVAVLCIPLVLSAGGVREVLPGVPPAPVRKAFAPALVVPAAPNWVGALCASAWLLAALCGVIRVAHGCRVVRALRRTSTRFDAARERRLPLWSQTPACARRWAELRVSEGLAGACALGFRQPVIVVGRTLVERLDDVALDQVIMHEHAHLARYDDWLQLFQAIARAVAGLHPAVWWLSRRIDLDREAACDDHVVARTGAARLYASTLLEAALAAGVQPTMPAIVPGATLRASALRRRVARLLDPARATGTRTTPTAALGMVLPVIAILAGPRVAPLVAFVDAVERPLPVENIARVDSHLPSPPVALSATEATPSTMLTRAPARRAPGVSRVPDAAPAAPSRPPDPAAPPEGTSEPTTGLPAGTRAPIESRGLFEHVDDRLLPAAPAAATMSGLILPSTPAAASRQARVTSSLARARGAASAVGSRAERGGLAIGRTFVRARQAIAGKF